MKNARLPSSPEKDRLPETSGMEKPQPQPEDNKPVPAAAQKESREEKERREARAILMERRDIEPGCPFPSVLRKFLRIRITNPFRPLPRSHPFKHIPQNKMKKLLAILSLFFCMTVTLMAQQVVTTWLSDAVVPGEQTRLFIILTDGSIARQDPLPRVKGASLRWVSQGNYIRWPGSPNQSAFLMAIEVTPDEVGTVEIPSLTLQANNGRTYTTLPQTLTVYPYSAIKWNTLNLNGTAVPYGMLWHVDNQKPYVHQPDRCELKIYAPEYILEYTAPAITTPPTWLPGALNPRWWNCSADSLAVLYFTKASTGMS